MFDSTMCFSPHINNITCKATRSLNFVKRNLKFASNTKSLAYTSLVRPTLEYASSARNLFLNKNILTIEMIQRQAACWVKSDYNWNSSVTAMLYDLKWSTLSHHQEVSRLKIFYNAIYNNSALIIPDCITTTTYTTHHQHPLHFVIPSVRTNYYKYSFFLRTFRDWNNLPIGTIESPTLELFLSNLSD